MLSAPRRSPATPSPDGKLAIYTQSTYSFDTHNKTNEICVLDIANGQEVCISKDPKASEPRWLGSGYDIVWLKEGENGNTSFVVSDASQPGKSYTAGTVAGPVSNLKLHVIEAGMVAVAVAGQASSDGSLFNSKDEVKPASSARIYDSLFVRHWDRYVTAQRKSIFTALLQKSEAKVMGRQGRYSLLGFKNALQAHKLECPIPPFGGTDHFDISSQGIAFVAKDPELDPATHTKCNLYFVKRQDLMDMSTPEVIKIDVPGIDGAATSPSFSPDGRSLALLKMKTDGYESDKNRIILVHGLPGSASNLTIPALPVASRSGVGDRQVLSAQQEYPCAYADSLDENTGKQKAFRRPEQKNRQEATLHRMQSRDWSEPEIEANEFLPTSDGKGGWDRSPSAVTWSVDGNSLLLQAEDKGAGCLWILDLMAPPVPGKWQPRKLTQGGYVTDVAPLAWDSLLLFVSGTSLVDNSVYYIVNPLISDLKLNKTEVSSLSSGGSLFGLSPTQVSSLWWIGAHGREVHAWMIVPSFFKPNQKYPLAFIVHGGPQGAWNDQWSTRWNPAVFAEQGYIVVCPNPTGSTGYGQDFTDAIRNQWGGLPYEDLVKCMDHIENEVKCVDMDKCVALGASYGGYMMMWVQGHELAKRFQALVCHDGVFSMTAQVASDEQYFPIHDLGGPIWDRQEMYDKWDPARFTASWETPMLVIHNELDYRLTMAEGLSAFNVLQMRGIKSRFLSFPDENHFVLGPENSKVWHLQVLNWINSFVGLGKVVDMEGKDGTEYRR